MSEIQDFKELRIREKGMSIAEKCYSLYNYSLIASDELEAIPWDL
jgi:hypothetical protein